MDKQAFAASRWTMGELNALLKNIGEENAKKIQKGEIFQIFFENNNTTELFDTTGRRITKNLLSQTTNTERHFCLSNPAVKNIEDYEYRLSLANIKDPCVTPEWFKHETERQIAMIAKDDSINNILKNIYLPIVCKIDSDNIDNIVRNGLEAVAKQYTDLFKNRIFCNYIKNCKENKITIAPDSRHFEFLGKAKQKYIVAILFPRALQGFSVNASREQLLDLTYRFSLSGAEIINAIIMYPDILLSNWYATGLTFAGINYKNDRFSLSIKAYENMAGIDAVSNVSAYNIYSPALTFSA